MAMNTAIPPLQLSTRPHGRWIVVQAAGDLDLATAPSLGATASDAAHDASGAVALDLAAIRFIDSSGLRTLLELRQSEAMRVVLVDPSSAVRDLLHLTMMSDAFETIESLDGLDTI